MTNHNPACGKYDQLKCEHVRGGFDGWEVVGRWPKFICVPDYDTGTPVRGRVELSPNNGDAVYRVDEECPYGCGYHLSLIRGKRVGKKTAARRSAAVRFSLLAAGVG